MTKDIIKVEAKPLAKAGENQDMPAVVRFAGGNARFAYEEFFSGIDSSETERAYRNAVKRFLEWCEEKQLALQEIRPTHVSDYIKHLKNLKTDEPAGKATRKLHLSGIRHFFDKCVVRHAIALNPAASVRGPKHKVTEGKTSALSVKQARELLADIDTTDVVGLRDRAIIAVMMYTGVRVGAVAKLRRQDFYHDGTQSMFRFDEKGGKVRNIPCRSDLETFMRDYLDAAGPAGEETPLFRSAVRKTKRISHARMTGNDMLRMVKRRFKAAGLPHRRLTCHSFRATTITDLLDQGVPLEDVQYLAGHADPRTTRLYDRRKRAVTRNIVERISI